MAEHKAEILWNREGARFIDNRYSRRHQWIFDGGIKVPASSSPQVVPVPLSEASAVDPAEAFVASLASCHMLWFLTIAARRGFTVESYRDEAIGIVGRNAENRLAVLEVTLRPQVIYSGPHPSEAESREMHAESHRQCFIANSVKTAVKCEPAGASTATGGRVG
jgi:organic hydroperoxide reductase OsmC/OhrA